MVYIGFGGFRHPLAALECILHGLGGLLYTWLGNASVHVIYLSV